MIIIPKHWIALWKNYEDEPNATLLTSESFKPKVITAGSNPAPGNQRI